MRALFTSQPAHGHFRPLVQFAQALQRRGASVRFATSERFRPVIERAGFDTVRVGLDFSLAEASSSIPGIPPPGPERIEWMTPFWFENAARAARADILQLAEQWRPDVIVRDYLELGGAYAAAALEIESIVAGAVWFRKSDVVDASIARALAEHRVDTASPTSFPYRGGVWGAFPKSWLAPEEVVPARLAFVRPRTSTGALTLLPRRRTSYRKVHFTMGTTEVKKSRDIYNIVVEAVAPLCDELLITGAPEGCAAGWPTHVKVSDFIEHDALIPTCDLLICNGGYGSVMSALAERVPVLVLPVQADQPRNGARCEALGVGLTVKRSDWSVARIREAATSLLSGSHLARLTQFSEELRGLPSADDVVGLWMSGKLW